MAPEVLDKAVGKHEVEALTPKQLVGTEGVALDRRDIRGILTGLGLVEIHHSDMTGPDRGQRPPQGGSAEIHPAQFRQAGDVAQHQLPASTPHPLLPESCPRRPAACGHPSLVPTSSRPRSPSGLVAPRSLRARAADAPRSVSRLVNAQDDGRRALSHAQPTNDVPSAIEKLTAAAQSSFRPWRLPKASSAERNRRLRALVYRSATETPSGLRVLLKYQEDGDAPHRQQSEVSSWHTPGRVRPSTRYAVACRFPR